MRQFETGAIRDDENYKLDYEGFLSPLAIERYAQYMHKHRKQTDGNLRASDNWQRGIPKEAYMKSMFRHLVEVWKSHRNIKNHVDIEDSLCGVLFNAMGYLHEIVKARQSDLPLVNEPPSIPSSASWEKTLRNGEWGKGISYEKLREDLKSIPRPNVHRGDVEHHFVIPLLEPDPPLEGM